MSTFDEIISVVNDMHELTGVDDSAAVEVLEAIRDGEYYDLVDGYEDFRAAMIAAYGKENLEW